MHENASKQCFIWFFMAPDPKNHFSDRFLKCQFLTPCDPLLPLKMPSVCLSLGGPGFEDFVRGGTWMEKSYPSFQTFVVAPFASSCGITSEEKLLQRSETSPTSRIGVRSSFKVWQKIQHFPGARWLKLEPNWTEFNWTFKVQSGSQRLKKALRRH